MSYPFELLYLLMTEMDDVVIDVDEDTTTELVAAVAGAQIWVYGWAYGTGVAAGTYQFKSAGDAKTGLFPVSVIGQGSSVGYGLSPIFKCATAEALNLVTVTASGDGVLSYRVVPQ